MEPQIPGSPELPVFLVLAGYEYLDLSGLVESQIPGPLELPAFPALAGRERLGLSELLQSVQAVSLAVLCIRCDSMHCEAHIDSLRHCTSHFAISGFRGSPDHQRFEM